MFWHLDVQNFDLISLIFCYLTRNLAFPICGIEDFDADPCFFSFPRVYNLLPIFSTQLHVYVNPVSALF